MTLLTAGNEPAFIQETRAAFRTTFFAKKKPENRATPLPTLLGRLLLAFTASSDAVAPLVTGIGSLAPRRPDQRRPIAADELVMGRADGGCCRRKEDVGQVRICLIRRVTD